jgi:hypothetical protein
MEQRSMQHAHVHRPSGTKPIAIEVDGEPLGVVIREDGGYRFLAVRYSAFPIDGQVFDTVEAATEAASETVATDR